MSSGAQVDLDWAGTDVVEGGSGGAATAAPGTGTADARYLSDEEILGITPAGGNEAGRDSSGTGGPRNDKSLGDGRGDSDRADGDGSLSGEGAAGGESAALGHKGAQAEAYATGAAMPGWMVAAAADAKNGAEARALWVEHQEFRAAFASPVEARAVAEEARAIKELLPGGVRDAVSLREATQSVERIDAALFSGDVRAQAEVVAEMARTNPAAFRSMFAEAARVLAGLDAGGRGQGAGGRDGRNLEGPFTSGFNSANGLNSGPTLREGREGWGTQNQDYKSQISNLKLQSQDRSQSRDRLQSQDRLQGRDRSQNQDRQWADGGQSEQGTDRDSQFTNRESRAVNQNGQQVAGATNSADRGLQVTNHQSPVTSHQSQPSQSPRFDPAAYAAFERATNDAVARDVRGSIGDTLARVMPEGVADGAARRIGEDIFTEVHRALAADRSLSEQVASVLRDPPSPNGGYGGLRPDYGGVRFGPEQQQRVAALVAGRAKQLVPSVARRVIGEWTGTVLNTARSKAARQAAAASRVDIAAPGGSSDSMPLRAMSPREVNYASMSDEQILGM